MQKDLCGSRYSTSMYNGPHLLPETTQNGTDRILGQGKGTISRVFSYKCLLGHVTSDVQSS